MSRKDWNENPEKQGRIRYFQIGAALFLLYLCIHYWDSLISLGGTLLDAALPLILGAVAAYVLNLPMSFFERHYFPNSTKKSVRISRRPVCMLLAFAAIALAVALLIYIVVPELINCISLLLNKVPKAVENIMDKIADSELITENLGDYLEDIDWKQTFSKIVETVLGGIGNAGDYAVSMVSVFVSTVANVVIALIFAIYILAGKERLGRQVRRVCRHFLKKKWMDRITHVVVILDDSFHRYVTGQCTEAVILGCLCTIGMMIFQFPYAAVTGVTIGFTALIPVAGAYIGGAVGFLLTLTASPLKAVLFLVYLVVLQQLEGNIIYPRVVGTSLGLPGIWVLAAVVIGGSVGGVGGMLLGVPLCAAAYRLLKEEVEKDDVFPVKEPAEEDTAEE